MKKFVYDIFVQNNIFLSKSTIEFILKHVQTKDCATDICKKYIKAFGYATVSLNDVKTLFNAPEKLFTTKNCRIDIDKYDFLYKKTLKAINKNKRQQQNKGYSTEKENVGSQNLFKVDHDNTFDDICDSAEEERKVVKAQDNVDEYFECDDISFDSDIHNDFVTPQNIGIEEDMQCESIDNISDIKENADKPQDSVYEHLEHDDINYDSKSDEKEGKLKHSKMKEDLQCIRVESDDVTAQKPNKPQSNVINEYLEGEQIIKEIDQLEVNKNAFIFGLFCSNYTGQYFLKDKSNKIKLLLDSCPKNINAFVTQGMFVGIYGHKADDGFIVLDIILPHVDKKANRVNNELKCADFSVLIFSKPPDFATLNFILTIYDIMPELVVIYVPTNQSLKYASEQLEQIHLSTQVILILDFCVLKENLILLNAIRKKKNIEIKIDSCNVTFYDRLISFQSTTFCRQMCDNGIFIGKNAHYELAKAITSQYSSNFIFDTLEVLPRKQDLFFIFSDRVNISYNVNNVNFVIFSQNRNKLDFYFYDSTKNTCECSVYMP